MGQTRREFLGRSGVGLLAYWVGGCEVEMTPEEARRSAVPLRVLDEDQASAVEALGEQLVPGSAKAGLVHFLDHQLSAAPDRQMLMVKYLGVSPPFADFYAAALAGLDAVFRQRHGVAFARAPDEAQLALVTEMAQQNPAGWSGPPAPFFFFVLRNDAVDVVYGTREGFDELGVPYMAHIEPPSRWGA